MNKVKRGRDFEREAYEILSKKFEKVEWLSGNSRSNYDFKIWDKGEVFYGDAKFCGGSWNAKPSLNYSQRDADFVIVKIKDSAEIIWKKDFNERVRIMKDKYYIINIFKEDAGFLTDFKEDKNLISKAAAVKWLIKHYKNDLKVKIE